MIVVSDTSPLNYLILIGEVDLLSELFERVIAPPSVIDELIDTKSPPLVRTWAGDPPPWLETRLPMRIDSTIGLHVGEVDAISLAKEIGADRLIVDDARARTAAMSRGVSVAGTLAVLLEASDRNLIDLPSAIDKLRRTTFRASSQIWKHFSTEST